MKTQVFKLSYLPRGKPRGILSINRFHGPAAIHLIGCRLSLDKRAAGARGAASQNPHGLVQEFLNRSDEHLWAILSNGMTFRILRDNEALSRQSYLEFDLAAMFEGELYSDFVLLWLLGHATRFSIKEGERPDSCWLEQWTKIAEEQGTRALESLRGGVEKALQTLGQGLVSHPRNTRLREHLREGSLTLTELHSQLLRVVYRLIFLFVAEDRHLDGIPVLHPRSADPRDFEKRERYTKYYSLGRLRDLASGIRGSRHGDLWHQFNLVVGALSGEERFAAIRKHLNLPILGSFLWDPASTQHLNTSELSEGQAIELSNSDFLEAIRNLAFIHEGKILRPVDYKNLGSEELGGVYESQLALTPRLSAGVTKFNFAELAGSERKLSGSYYTPDSLVQSLLDSALDPVVEAAIKGKRGEEAEAALLSLKVCDPAVGSGHFLVGAAHRLARHLARIRALSAGESEPSPLLYQTALRDVIGHCLYGVDINPMSAELCKVSLWLEALEPGKPFSFLDHHIQVGNSLLGTTPDLMATGIPDEAFNPLEGDDRKICALYKKRNREERRHGGRQEELLLRQVAEPQAEFNSVMTKRQDMDDLPDAELADVQLKAQHFAELVTTQEYRHTRLMADAWCAAFVWPITPAQDTPITETVYRRLVADSEQAPAGLMEQVQRLAGDYGFFHWHLAFPEVSAQGGFDCVLGNPPWERVKIQEKEWFAERLPMVAAAPNAAARKKLIEALRDEDPALHQAFQEDLRKSEGESHFLRNSGRFPLCGRGDINVYTVFAELMRTILNEKGRAGCVLPTGIATDDTTKFFFQEVVGTRSLISLFDFENRKGLFPAVDSRMKFCLFTVGRGLKPIAEQSEFVFFAHAVEELRDPERRFRLSPADIELLNPNTHTCPIFRSRKDAELTKAIYRRVPVLIREARDGRPEENPWGIQFKRMFDMSNDSHLFRTREQLEAEGWRLEGNVFLKGEERYLPLYEAKMIHHFDHRWATYEGLETRNVTLAEKQDPNFTVMGRYWVHADEVQAALANTGWNQPWLMGWRDITNTTNERTVISTTLPLAGVGNKIPLFFPTTSESFLGILLSSSFSTLSQDFIARQKIGGTTLNFYLFKQLPIITPVSFQKCNFWTTDNSEVRNWLLPRIIELIYSSFDMSSLSSHMNWNGPPFIWNNERRFLIRCELDAAFFRLYLPSDATGQWRPALRSDGCPYDETPEQLAELRAHFTTPRDAVDYILDTFPIVRRKDEAEYGEFRTKRVILEIYDAMQEAIRTGVPYRTRLDPPPGPPEEPLPEWKPGQPRPEDWPVHIHPPKGVTDGD